MGKTEHTDGGSPPCVAKALHIPWSHSNATLLPLIVCCLKSRGTQVPALLPFADTGPIAIDLCDNRVELRYHLLSSGGTVLVLLPVHVGGNSNMALLQQRRTEAPGSPHWFPLPTKNQSSPSLISPDPLPWELIYIPIEPVLGRAGHQAQAG